MKCPSCYSENIVLQKVSLSNETEHIYYFCQSCGQNKAVSRESFPNFHQILSIPYEEAKDKLGLNKKGKKSKSKEKQEKSESKPKFEFSKDNEGNFIDSKISGLDYYLYCDGICEPNPGESGFGLVVYKKDTLYKLFYGGYKNYGTNNLAELQGLYASLKYAEKLVEKNKTVQILCDSMYAISCIASWSYKWKQKDWNKNKKKQIKNLDIIQKAHTVYDSIKDKIKISHIKGHAGFEGNELADKMSQMAIKERNVQIVEFTDSKDINSILNLDILL